MDRSHAWQRIAETASRQAGMVGHAQLLALGLSRDEVHCADDLGRLRRVHVGVRALGYVRDEPEARWWAAVLAGAPEGRLTARSAIENYGLLSVSSGAVHIAVRRERRFARDGIVVHRPREFRAQDTRVVRGLATTEPSRALVELAAAAHPAVVRRAVHEGLVTGLVTVEAVLDVLGPRSRRPGARTLRRALGAGAVDLRSRFERLFLRIAERVSAQIGLASPLVNEPLAVPWGIVRPDFRWPSVRLIVEIDGLVVHGTQLARAEDQRRDRRLKVLGWDVSRFPGEEVEAAPDQAADELLALLLAARGRHG